MDLDLSTRFEDWIDTDLLKVNKPGIDKIVLNDYSINERTRSVDRRDNLVLSKKDGTWQTKGMSSNQMIDSTVMETLLTTLDSLTIVGVRPKPAGLSQSLVKDESTAEISQSDMFSLQNKGFFFSRDGQLMSNEGELIVNADNGVVYTLRFGEVVYGSGLAVTAGTDKTESAQTDKSGQNRYLFVTTKFDESRFPEPRKPENTDFLNKPDSLLTDADRENKKLQSAYKTWENKVKRGRDTSHDLNAHYADWYYVISSDSFDKLHRKRSELVVKKTEKS
jgi:hypothetical protein